MRKGKILDVSRAVLGSLIFGVLIWYIARNEMTVEEQVDLSVRMEHGPDVQVEGENGQPLRARATLSGPALALERTRDAIERGTIVARLRLAPDQAATAGTYRVPITESATGRLPDPRVHLGLVDREVRIVVTPWETKMVPVNLVTDLDPSRLRSALDKQTVEVRGPKSVVDRLTTVNTERVELAKLLESGQKQVQRFVTIAKELDGKPIPIECDEGVWAKIDIGEEMIQQNVDVRVGLYTAFDFPYDVRIVELANRAATVTLRGPQSILTDPDLANRVLVFVTVNDARKFKPRDTSYLVDRQVRLPAGVEMRDITLPEKINVDILERKPPAPPVGVTTPPVP